MSEESKEKIRQKMLGNKNPMYKKGISRKHTKESKDKMSLIKKELYKTTKHPRLGKILSEESRIRMSISHLGQIVSDNTKIKLSETHSKDRHWNWRVDRNSLVKSERKHEDSCHKEWSKNVKDRDGWKCRISDNTCFGRLEAHHILDWSNYPTYRYTLSNGITLCHAHHPRGRSEEKRLVEYFNSLVSVSR